MIWASMSLASSMIFPKIGDRYGSNHAYVSVQLKFKVDYCKIRTWHLDNFWLEISGAEIGCSQTFWNFMAGIEALP